MEAAWCCRTVCCKHLSPLRSLMGGGLASGRHLECPAGGIAMAVGGIFCCISGNLYRLVHTCCAALLAAAPPSTRITLLMRTLLAQLMAAVTAGMRAKRRRAKARKANGPLLAIMRRKS